MDFTIARAHQHAADARHSPRGEVEPAGGFGDEPADRGLGRLRGGFAAKLPLSGAAAAGADSHAWSVGGLCAVHDGARRDPGAAPARRWRPVAAGTGPGRRGALFDGKPCLPTCGDVGSRQPSRSGWVSPRIARQKATSVSGCRWSIRASSVTWTPSASPRSTSGYPGAACETCPGRQRRIPGPAHWIERFSMRWATEGAQLVTCVSAHDPVRSTGSEPSIAGRNFPLIGKPGKHRR